jgi:putative FmdB family regulatory protein
VPTYDYRCRACGHTFETVHSILDEGPTACERCGGRLDRVLHPAGVIFKGSGFYATDSRKAPPSEGAGSGSSESSGSGTTSAPKKEKPSTPGSSGGAD